MMEGSLGFSCPASLQSIFKYYGVDVVQNDIFTESYSSRSDFTATGGTNVKWFPRAASFQGYNDENWGFHCTVMSLVNLTHEERLEFVKRYLREGIPIFSMCKKYTTWPSHYKVFIGFDERNNYWYHNDPWYDTDGVDRCGPMSATSAEAGAHYDNTWSNTNYTIGIVLPIRVHLGIENRPVDTQTEFDLTCELDISHLELTSDITLNVTLPDGYRLVSGNATPIIPLSASSLGYTWTIESSDSENSQDEIRVLATAARNNYTTGGFSIVRPFVPDAPSIAKPSSDYSNDDPPFTFNAYSNIDCDTTYSASVLTFSYSDSTRFHPQYRTANPVDDEINMTLEAYRPRTPVFTWIEVSTPYGNYTSEKNVFLIQSSDWDGDGLEGYQEVSRIGTDPNCNDTDRDFLSDADEVNIYGTDPLLNDTDSDLLLDGLEIEAGTDPFDPDSDSDGDLDGIEILYGLDPLNPESNVAVMQQTQMLLIGSVGLVCVVVVTLVIWRRKG
jgi:hypothetical protein